MKKSEISGISLFAAPHNGTNSFFKSRQKLFPDKLISTYLYYQKQICPTSERNSNF